MRDGATKVAALAIAVGIACCGPVAAQGHPPQTAPAAPVVLPDGAVRVPAFELPPSDYMSKEALAFQKRRAGPSGGGLAALDPKLPIAEVRAAAEKQAAPLIAIVRARYKADVAEQTIGGVKTRVFTPADGKIDPRRILINLHGGSFSMCAEACAYLESLPIAALGGFKVVSVDYRQGPEHVHPAASEDVAAVYKALLKNYKPSQIGIYGCSAGGALSAMTAAWLPAHGLPQAGAIGVFGSGASPFGGDSACIAAVISGAGPLPRPDPAQPLESPMPYFKGADLKDPMIAPALHPEVAAKFPPTLLITGTRAMDLSAAAFTHSQLLKAGVEADLIVAEGQGHCYIYLPLPEAYDAHKSTVDFFRKHLG